MPHTIAHQNAAAYLNETLGDLLDGVAFTDLTNAVVANPEAVADRLAESEPPKKSSPEVRVDNEEPPLLSA